MLETLYVTTLILINYRLVSSSPNNLHTELKKYFVNHKIKGALMYLLIAFDSMSLGVLLRNAKVYGFSKDPNIFVFSLRALEAIS